MGDVLVLGEFCVICGANAWLGIGKVRHEPPDWRPPRGLWVGGDVMAQAPPDWRPPRGLVGLAGLRADAPSEARGADGERAGRPRGGRRSGGARQRSEIWRGAAEAGDLAGCGRRAGGQASRWPEIWRVTANTGKQTGARMRKNRRPEGRRLSVRHGGLEPSTR